jgi:undecaprenyl-diphosphatase
LLLWFRPFRPAKHIFSICFRPVKSKIFFIDFYPRCPYTHGEQMITQLIQCDTALFWHLNHFHHPAGDVFFRIITQLGNAWVIIPLFLVIIFIKIPPVRRRRVIIFALAGLIIGGGANSLLKTAIQRPRPLTYFASHHQYSVDHIHVLGQRLKHRSFPSGHTTTAFAAATMLVMLWGLKLWFAYILALLVAYSRVYMGVHFPLDTVAGALLGTSCIGIIMYFYKRKYRDPE